MPQTLHTAPGAWVWLWNSYTGEVDENGNPVLNTQVTGDPGLPLNDGDTVLLCYNGVDSDAFFISYDDNAGLPGSVTDYAITYSMDTTLDLPADPDNNAVPPEAFLDPADPNNSCDLEVDPTVYENYDQYYDENDDPVYEVSDCNDSIGIRG